MRGKYATRRGGRADTSVILSGSRVRPIFSVPPTRRPLSTRRSTPTPQRAADIEASPTDSLLQVASALANAGTAADGLTAALVAVRERLGADGARLWIERGRGELEPVASAGLPAAEAATVRTALDGRGAPRLRAVAVTGAGVRLGALAVDGGTRAGDSGSFLAGVATLLAPALRDAEARRSLEAEVAARSLEAEAQRRFTARIIDSLPVGLYVIDREYRIQAWNRKRETGMQGVSREEAIGRTIFEILHRQPAELLRAEFEDVFRTGRMQQFQIESHASGELRTYRITKIPMRLDDGEVTHVITIGEDITEWREAQERFAQAEKLAAIGTLAAGVMHEINNPLATIGACAESLTFRVADGGSGGEGFAAELRDALAVIQHEVQRCAGIVAGLLDFSRPKSTAKEPLDLDGVVDKTLFLLKNHSRFKRLTVHAQLARALPAVMGSEEQLIQVFMALLLNAMDAMEGRGTITLRTRVDAAVGDVVAEVVDEGAGIRSSELKKIFEPFYTSKPPGRGTGLGLSICYALIAEHGGRIEVDSTPGKGSVFRIILPRAGALA